MHPAATHRQETGSAQVPLRVSGVGKLDGQCVSPAGPISRLTEVVLSAIHSEVELSDRAPSLMDTGYRVATGCLRISLGRI